MKCCVFNIAVILLFFTSGFAQSTKVGGYAANGQYIGFFQFLPEGYAKSSVKYPLIISLHGIGEKGNGTTELDKVQCCGIPAYIKGGNKMRFTWNGKTESFIVLTPQLNAKYGNWQDFYVDELIKYAIRSLKVDPDRIILTGLSLGGGGTWSYASTSAGNAHMFAGIVPVVAPCFIKNACIIAKAGLPVFALHALDDTVAKAQCTINSIRLINACNPLVSANVIIYPNGGHVVFFNKTYDTAHRYQDPNVYEWMLAQNRKLPPNRKPVARLAASASVTSGKGLIVMDGTGSYDPDGKLVSCSWQRISGPQPGTLTILSPGKAEISGLTAAGIYTFLIKVVDDRAEWSTDTISVSLTSGTPLNIAPIANAGKDVAVSTGQSVALNANASKDADGSIMGYQWSLASGPSSLSIPSSTSMATAVRLLQPGVYQFRLQVIDNKGAISTDITQVNVSGNNVVVDLSDTTFQPSGADNETELPDINPLSISDPVFHPIGVQTSAETEQSPGAVIFPNPATSFFNIRIPFALPVNTIVRIYGTTGNLVRTIQTNTGINLSAGSIPAGVYYAEILCSGHHALYAQFIKR
jgi:hypothetical protein